MQRTNSMYLFCVGFAACSCAAAQETVDKARPGHGSLPGYELVVAETPVDAMARKQLQLDCPAGKKALGAGWAVLDASSAILDGMATYSEPSYDGRQWVVNAANLSTYAAEWKLRVRLVCATAY